MSLVGQDDERPTTDSRGRLLPVTFDGLASYLIDYFLLQDPEAAKKDIELALQSVKNAVSENYATVLDREKARIEKRQYVDKNTGLANREGYKLAAIKTLMEESQANYLSVAVIDLVGFGIVDNTFGLLQGDMVLKAAARALSEVARDRRGHLTIRQDQPGQQRVAELTDITARFGGDEFLYLLREREPKGYQIVLRAKEKVQDIDWVAGSEVKDLDLALETREYLISHPLDFRAGVVEYKLPDIALRQHRSAAGATVDQLFNHADKLMRDYKTDPSNPVHWVEAESDGSLVKVRSEVQTAVL